MNDFPSQRLRELAGLKPLYESRKGNGLLHVYMVGYDNNLDLFIYENKRDAVQKTKIDIYNTDAHSEISPCLIENDEIPEFMYVPQFYIEPIPEDERSHYSKRTYDDVLVDGNKLAKFFDNMEASYHVKNFSLFETEEEAHEKRESLIERYEAYKNHVVKVPVIKQKKNEVINFDFKSMKYFPRGESVESFGSKPTKSVHRHNLKVLHEILGEPAETSPVTWRIILRIESNNFGEKRYPVALYYKYRSLFLSFSEYFIDVEEAKLIKYCLRHILQPAVI